MALFELIEENVVKVPLKSSGKNDVIRELINILKDAGKISDTKAAYTAVLDREKLSSTGLGGGIAIPHAKIPTIAKLTVALGISPNGIDFESIDDEPAKIFFLILASPLESGPHLQALTDIAKISRDGDFLTSLLSAGTAAEIVELFKKVS